MSTLGRWPSGRVPLRPWPYRLNSGDFNGEKHSVPRHGVHLITSNARFLLLECYINLWNVMLRDSCTAFSV